MVKVNTTRVEEIIDIILNGVANPTIRDGHYCQLVEEVADCLHWNALAMKLAAVRIEVDVDHGDGLDAALRRYLPDYRYNYERLLLDLDFVNADENVRAVRTASAVSLSSLKQRYDRGQDSFPMELLSFMTFFNPAGTQDELWRLGSLALDEACNRTRVEAPVWMRALFKKDRDGCWDDTAYRETIRVLRRYHLVTPVGEPWKGITMDGAVRQQVGMDMVDSQYWRLYVVFMTAACAQSEEEEDVAYFRQHLIMHLPPNDYLREFGAGPHARGLRWLWLAIARVLSKAHEWRAAEELVTWTIEESSTLVGENDPDTITVMANLATLYCNQGRWADAELLDAEVLHSRLVVLGEQHLDTIIAMEDLANTYENLGRSEEAKVLVLKALKSRFEAFDDKHPDMTAAINKFIATYYRHASK